MSLSYLAAPYSHDDPNVRSKRAATATLAAAQILQHSKRIVYSPLTHGHQIGMYLTSAMNDDHAFWMRQCYEMLDRCDDLIVLTLDGWRESKGVQMEIARARMTCKPIIYMLFEFGALNLQSEAPEA